MQPEADSCYFCEIGKEGLFVPLNGYTVLICQSCVLACIYAHPKLLHHRKVA
jgi:hypothetical protein